MSPKPTSAFAPPPKERAKTVKRDTADEAAEKAYVRTRDRGCVAQRAFGFANGYSGYYVGQALPPCDGPLEVDHVRASGALSKKSVTHRSNMVLLCRWHHKLKTEYGRTWRPLLLVYLERVERSRGEEGAA